MNLSSPKPGRIAFVILGLLFLVLFTPCSPAKSEEVKEVALDFDDVDIRLFIRVISELTERNFIIDNNVRGKVTVLSPRKLTTQQAYQVFKSVLAVNGFTLVDAGEVTKIIRIQHMSGQSLPLHTRKLLKGEDHFITQVMPLKYLDANGLRTMIKPLLSKQSNIMVPPASDLLIVTDYESNIKKIDRLLDEIDIEITDQRVEMLDLKNASATTTSSKITEVLTAKYGKTRKGSRPIVFKIVPLERINSVIAVASPDIFTEIESILTKIDQPTPEEKSLLNVYYLENAKAEDMVQILTATQKALVSSREGETPQIPQQTEAGGVVLTGKYKALGEEITITADKSTNSLIIYAKPDDYAVLKSMIEKLDIPRNQVYLQVLILEVSPNEDFNFGTEWVGFQDVGHPVSSDARTAVFGSNKQGGGIVENLLTGGDITALGSGFAIGAITEGISLGDFTFPSLSVVIRAVETLSSVNILSKPQLMTLNNEAATINISTNRPFQTSSTILEGGGTSQNLEYRDVGTILDITPQINKNKKINLEISLEVSKLSGTVAANQPITLKRSFDTVVEVNDNGTIVIGGLIEEQRDFSKNTVPCLGGIPYLGWAFKSVGVSDTKTNLLVFISPKVFETPMDADTLTKEKKQYMDEESKRQKEEVLDEGPSFMKYVPKPEE